MKVISFSLWGSQPKYTVGAIRNAELAAQVYPEWVCRFYCGASVPDETLEKLAGRKNVDVRRMSEPGDWRGLFWRFLPAADPTVEVMLSRDTDSRLNARERAAVDDWLENGRAFHVMRDHPWHNTPILGGMWGVRRGALDDIESLFETWDKADRWGPDQEFLAATVAPRAKTSWREHDPYFARIPFPTPRRRREFVGQPFDETDRPIITGPSDLETALRRIARRVLAFVRRA